MTTSTRVNPVSWLLATVVRGYQLIVSPWLAPRCRYYPSCSAYAVSALHRHGPVTAVLLAGWRLLRCNPWSAGGVDFVPDRGHLPWQEAWRRRRERRRRTASESSWNELTWEPGHHPDS